jgi:peptide deformylase
VPLRKVLQAPNTGLHVVAAQVYYAWELGPGVVDDLTETMYAAPACGLSAPQIGIPKRLFVLDVAREDEPSSLRVFFNPKIVRTEGTQTLEEACLSLPGLHKMTTCPARVIVRAESLPGGPTFEFLAEGITALAVVHEMNHLNGVLMVSRDEEIAYAARRAYREWSWEGSLGADEGEDAFLAGYRAGFAARSP